MDSSASFDNEHVAVPILIKIEVLEIDYIGRIFNGLKLFEGAVSGILEGDRRAFLSRDEEIEVSLVVVVECPNPI